MTIRGWITSSYYARTRNSAWILASMLFLAFAPSYTRAQAPAGVTGAEIHIGNASDLLLAMRTATPEARKAVDAAVAKADPAMVTELLRLKGSPAKRDNAQRAVVRMGRKAVPALFALFDDETAAVTAGSVLARTVTVKDFDLIPQLVLCAESKPEVSNYCATSLVKVSGSLAAAQVPDLMRCVKSANPELRAYCIAAIGRVGSKASTATDALIEALTSSDTESRARSAAALGSIGHGAVKSAPALRRTLKDPSAEVRREAKAALRKIGA